MPFQKGRQKTGGRKAGTPNKVTKSAREILEQVFTEESLAKGLARLGNDPDPRIRLEIFKFVFAYLFGRPAQLTLGEEPPPVKIDISAIPMKRERV